MAFFSNLAKKEKILYISGFLSLIILCGIILHQQYLSGLKDQCQKQAITYMQEMISAVSSFCMESGIEIDPQADPGMTGLIGPEWTEITTSIGHPEAKRTSIQPDFAALMVQLLREAGVQRGDTIALGCSGSFPGLLLASLSATRSMEVSCRTIISIGASSFGATRPELTILDIYNLLLDKEIITKPPLAVSLGGEDDTGSGWDDEIVDFLKAKIQDSGVKLIDEPDLKQNSAIRETLYGFNGGQEIKAFINAGGATANIGSNESILGLKPGLVKRSRIPTDDQQGIIHKALLKGIPVIHLLNIRGLAMEYGLKWDPVMGDVGSGTGDGGSGMGDE